MALHVVWQEKKLIPTVFDKAPDSFYASETAIDKLVDEVSSNETLLVGSKAKALLATLLVSTRLLLPHKVLQTPPQWYQ